MYRTSVIAKKTSIKLADQYRRGVYSSRILGSGWGRCRDCNEQDTGSSAKPRARKHSPGGNLPPAGQPHHAYACGCVLAYADKVFLVEKIL